MTTQGQLHLKEIAFFTVWQASNNSLIKCLPSKTDTIMNFMVVAWNVGLKPGQVQIRPMLTVKYGFDQGKINNQLYNQDLLDKPVDK